jgi:Protein of unknown function (DUF3117)
LGLEGFIRENHWSADARSVYRQQRWRTSAAVCGAGTGAPDLGHGLGSVRGDNMAAMKPRTGDGPLEVTKEGRGIVMRVPLEGGGRLVVEMTPDEANALSEALKSATG